MNVPMKQPSVLLSGSLILVFLMLVAVQLLQPKKEYITVSFENTPRLNQPGPPAKKLKKQQPKGNPTFLKEDLRDEKPSDGSTHLAHTESELVEQMTVREPDKTTSTKDRYLILAGAYTDHLKLLSKQAQYENRGLHSEIIRFNNKKARHICLGRFAYEDDALAYAKKITASLNIRTYVLDRTQ